MANIKARAERNVKVRRTIAKIEQTVAKLERMKAEYLKKATDAKARGESASYSLAKSGLNATLSQIKRAKEMLLNIEITAELQKMDETNADFLTGMSVIAKRISKVNKQSDFVKLQKEIEKALSGMEEAQAGLDVFLQNSDAAFAAISSVTGSLTDEQIDKLVDGKLSEKELFLDAEIDAIGVASPRVADVSETPQARMQASVGVDDAASAAPSPEPQSAPQQAVATPFPSPDGVFRFGAVEPPPSARFFATRKAAAVEIGTDGDGNSAEIDFSETPNILIGGMLGSGKSRLLHHIICSLLSAHSSKELRLLLIDSGDGELSAYNGTAHAAADAISGAENVSAALSALSDEIERRYAAFNGRGVRNIEQYNKSAEERMPYIAVVFDEYDMLMPAFEREYAALCRSAASAGIFTVVCTRDLTAKTVTGGIKANADAVIAFRTATEADSVLLYGTAGAEKLTGVGEFIFRGRKILAPRISDTDIKRATAALKVNVL
ncbi:MAG: FtsK/SpoIIIE domain-containing protein [Roseburia sp.]|nr:FtsK/SpoIIIE domain-containing protein [Roseburia sp.]